VGRSVAGVENAMMKVFLGAVLAAIAAPAVAAPASSMGDMSNMGAGQAGMVTADATGVVQAVDSKAGTVTIHHGPIAALRWPAMVMTFKATPPSILQGIRAGQTVNFQVLRSGNATTVTSITPK
jgi:Cu(I)/Ag(I) efflux system protein CusF